MAIFEVHAGAKIETMTLDEMRQTLAAWGVELARGVRFRDWSAKGLVSGGVWVVDPSIGQVLDTLGPDPGFVWAVTRVAVSGTGFKLGTDTYSVYKNAVTPLRLVAANQLLDKTWDPPALVLNGDEKLAFAGVGTLGGTEVDISGGAIELPVQLGWQLLG